MLHDLVADLGHTLEDVGGNLAFKGLDVLFDLPWAAGADQGQGDTFLV
jgi:hypothetical protein